MDDTDHATNRVVLAIGIGGHEPHGMMQSHSLAQGREITFHLP